MWIRLSRAFLERLGRDVVDFGFDGFLDKFEQHFGRGLTKALLLLIGLAVASICIGVIWRYLFAPVLAFFQVPGHLKMIAQIAVAGSATMSGCLFALRVYDWYLSRKVASGRKGTVALRLRVKEREDLLDAMKKQQHGRIGKRTKN